MANLQDNNQPVAWMMVNREPETGAAYLTFEKPTRVQKISHHPHELYTHPAPSWQGLSDLEIAKIIGAEWWREKHRYARAIEQALKEKNHART